MPKTLTQLRNELRRRLFDDAGGKLPNTLPGDAVYNDCINAAITHSAPYIIREVNETATVTVDSAYSQIALPNTVKDIAELALASAIAGYPPTPIESSGYYLTRSDDGTTTVYFRRPYANGSVVHIKGLTPYSTLESESQTTALDPDYIMHYAMARVYEALANRGGQVDTERAETSLMQYHDAEADKILHHQFNNPNYHPTYPERKS